MIDKKLLSQIVNNWLHNTEYFLVDITIDNNSRIIVEIDHKNGVWIEDCAKLSNFIQQHLKRHEQDYELEVGSAGLGQPFKVHRQYENHIGKNVEVLTQDGKKFRGILKDVNTTTFTLTIKEKQKEQGKKKAKIVNIDKVFNMDNIKYTKYCFKVN